MSTPKDIMDAAVEAAIRQDAARVEGLVRHFFTQHPDLGIDDIEIVCFTGPNGGRAYIVRQKGAES